MISTNKKLTILLTIIFITAVLVLVFSNHIIKTFIRNAPTSPRLNKFSNPRSLNSIKVGNVEIFVELAETSAQKAQGLSGREKLNENEGMLFVFKNKTRPSFWMKDMNFAIDIIWISDGKIVGIEKNVPAPEKNTPDSQLKFYNPPLGIDYVLEVDAEFSDTHNLQVGNPVELNQISQN